MACPLELAAEDLLEQLPFASCAPLLELGVTVPREPDHDERRPDTDVDVVDGLTAAPVEAVGDAQERGQLAEALLASGPERTELLRRPRLRSPGAAGGGGRPAARP